MWVVENWVFLFETSWLGWIFTEFKVRVGGNPAWMPGWLPDSQCGSSSVVPGFPWKHVVSKAVNLALSIEESGIPGAHSGKWTLCHMMSVSLSSSAGSFQFTGTFEKGWFWSDSDPKKNSHQWETLFFCSLQGCVMWRINKKSPLAWTYSHMLVYWHYP